MKTNRGFTIVELLTVMAVIAVLIGLLIPALSLVKDHSKQIQQKAQFHGIDVGLEMFKNEFGAYPESYDNILGPAPVEPTTDPDNYGGAQKLAEAMVGYDLLGFHPKSGFRSDGTKYFIVGGTGGYADVYDTVNGLKLGVNYSEANGAANVKARKGPMIDLENANAFRMQDVYGSINVGSFNQNNFVLCDVYAKKRTSTVKTGMPILYFKAQTSFQFQDLTDAGARADDIYNYDDNLTLIQLGLAENSTLNHEFETAVGGTNYEKFERMILNAQVREATVTATNTNGIKRPYRADTYIMISAGKDGNYGTADDIYNFDKGEKD